MQLVDTIIHEAPLPRFLNVTGDWVVSDNWSVESAYMSPPQKQILPTKKKGAHKKYTFILSTAFDTVAEFKSALLPELVQAEGTRDEPEEAEDEDEFDCAGDGAGASGAKPNASPKAKGKAQDGGSAPSSSSVGQSSVSSPPSQARQTISMSHLKDVLKKARS